jgi:hypothetical protein
VQGSVGPQITKRLRPTVVDISMGTGPSGTGSSALDELVNHALDGPIPVLPAYTAYRIGSGIISDLNGGVNIVPGN